MNQWAAWALAALAIWMLISGLDDLLIGFVSLFVKGCELPLLPEMCSIPERRIAILVPLWHEHGVIGRMLDRNVAAIDYSSYDVFVGVYPNDALTVRAVQQAASRHARVHVAMVPHDGPTSKGDCLNAIFAELRSYEQREGVRFETVVTHDAEDVIHAQSLRLINWYAREYAMVQIPVLALETPARELTHGLYCDDFAESQAKDIPVRQRLGGFLPSSGVGTGFERAALERLAASRDGKMFSPEALTEDYENGFALHALGYRQIFLPVRFAGGKPVATREYFPRNLRSAVRQRSRWVAGIALQGWQRHGWRVPVWQMYWFWRDRKSLIGNLLSPVTNVLFACGLAGWRIEQAGPRWLPRACGLLLANAVTQIVLRVRASARVYGWRHAAGVPLRILWGNAVNFLATAAALRQFTAAALRNRAPAWNKTEHVYPPMEQHRPLLGELLVRMKAVPLPVVETALAAKRGGMRLGEYLVQSRHLTEAKLYEALGTQAGIPAGAPPVQEVNASIAHTLPGEAVRRWRVLPYRVQDGQLLVATTEVPSSAMTEALQQMANLELSFRLVRPAELRALANGCGVRL